MKTKQIHMIIVTVMAWVVTILWTAFYILASFCQRSPNIQENTRGNDPGMIMRQFFIIHSNCWSMFESSLLFCCYGNLLCLLSNFQFTCFLTSATCWVSLESVFLVEIFIPAKCLNFNSFKIANFNRNIL